MHIVHLTLYIQALLLLNGMGPLESFACLRFPALTLVPAYSILYAMLFLFYEDILFMLYSTAHNPAEDCSLILATLLNSSVCFSI